MSNSNNTKVVTSISIKNKVVKRAYQALDDSASDANILMTAGTFPRGLQSIGLVTLYRLEQLKGGKDE